MAIKKEFLDLLACPQCRHALRENGGGLECVKCRVLYPVKDGIPVLLPDAAAPAGAAASGGANDGEKA
ncbi:MAG: Trm112 family protein [Elusimicrobia bacterium]|nr:Trm112 family protein [Elusimicrobiota bacterium]